MGAYADQDAACLAAVQSETTDTLGNSDFYYDTNAACTRCTVSNCASCGNTGTCETCADGYFVNGGGTCTGKNLTLQFPLCLPFSRVPVDFLQY